MEWIRSLYGEGTDLTVLQMSVRGITVFLAALIMLRFAGARTLGKKTAIDNVIMIMLGAILSRAVVGVSPFIPVLVSSFCIVLFHRLLAVICVYSDSAGKVLKGERISLYKDS